jgi:hypothetical protein
MWRFTVDDALIAIRYARHLVAGFGWRFDAHGPSTDGVTPLPWPLLLAPLALGQSAMGGDALVVLGRAKVVGFVAWVIAAAMLGRAVGRSAAPSWARAAALGVLALSVPVAAHAVSGMETGVAMALATAAVLLGERPRTAALVAGIAASLRPEMAPWALVLAVGFAVAGEGDRTRRAIEAGALALAPFVGCALVRAFAWGRPAPLAVLAKPSDLAHGAAYAGAALVVTLAPLLACAPWALARHPRGRAIAAAALVHVAVIVVVGGDWMPYARLMAPIAPSLVLAAVYAAERAHPASTAARSAAAVAVGVVLWARAGAAGRDVGADRAALIAKARPLLAGASRVAALDVGWVSAATEADIVDLAGLTDPEIAALPGGHTSKRVGARFLLDRAPDVLLIYAPEGLPHEAQRGGLAAWRDVVTPRAVEARLLDDDLIGRHFEGSAWLPLGTKGAGYVLLRSR